MYKRAINLPESDSFFLFGPRGTGKTALLRHEYSSHTDTLWLDLLSEDLFLKLSRRPALLRSMIEAKKYSWVILDEVQRIPSLLNEVHRLIEDPKLGKSLRFALTGSSARKLKRGGANLLAGRALVNNLHPLTLSELGPDFDLLNVLHFGSLPRVQLMKSRADREQHLTSYVSTYIREEIREEQIVRKLDPFLRFLEVAAAANGQPINMSNIARDCAVDPSAVTRYYQILEDTLLGFFLPTYSRSIRARQGQSPKFYFFDLGVKRALEGIINEQINPGSSEFGFAFEQLVILEAIRQNDYLRSGYRFSYLRTDSSEIDLIIEKGKRVVKVIEIKSSERVDEVKLRKFARLAADISSNNVELWFRGNETMLIDGVTVLPWQDGLNRLFSASS
jgi:predicted AAA+ superfamily ATPase